MARRHANQPHNHEMDFYGMRKPLTRQRSIVAVIIVAVVAAAAVVALFTPSPLVAGRRLGLSVNETYARVW